MKKYRFCLLILCSFFLFTSCGKKKTVSTFTCDKVIMQHNLDKVTITDTDKIKKLNYLFDESNYTRNKEYDGGKGWVYWLTAYQGETKKEICVLDDKSIQVDNKGYDLEKIDINELDIISGIQR